MGIIGIIGIMLVYQKTTNCYKHVLASAWSSGKPSVQETSSTHTPMRTWVRISTSPKKKALKQELKKKKKY